ncbi:MAG: hypothetical protein ACKOPS_24215, partial [Cyanobium sp.]
ARLPGPGRPGDLAGRQRLNHQPPPSPCLPEMSDVLVNVDNVSKRFCRSLKHSLWTGLQAAAMAAGADCRRAALMCSCGRTRSGR